MFPLSSAGVWQSWQLATTVTRYSPRDTGVVRGAAGAWAAIGCGIDVAYPPENKSLAEEIAAKGGAVVTEFPFGVKPDRQNFPMRNRIISGWSLGVVVVEAALQSGALITAHQAGEQGRHVFAVPGRADSILSRGTNKLIKDGAKLTEDVDDVLGEFEYLLPPAKAAGNRVAESGAAPALVLSELEDKIVTVLPLPPLRRNVNARVALMPTSQSASLRHRAACASGCISSSVRSRSKPSRIASVVIDCNQSRRIGFSDSANW